MYCNDCMFFQEGEKLSFQNIGMPRAHTKCSLGVTLIIVPGGTAIPGPPYNLPPDQVDYTFNNLGAAQMDVCPNFRPNGGYGGNYDQGGQPPASPMSSHKVGDGSSGCFLTSACVDALGKEDDCYELTMLRKFRDGWLSNQEGGKSDIERYYSFAPLVVVQIDALPNRLEVYEGIYSDLVDPCVKLIEEGRMDEAWKLYKGYAEELIIRYSLSAA